MLTDVELLFQEGQVERWIRFGRWAEERMIDRRRRVVSFAPGSMFALVRWQGGDYGATQSRLDILRAVRPGEAFTTTPFVAPGGELHARLQGWPKVQKALETIEAVEALGIEPADAAPDYWRCMANRIEVGQRPRPYSLARHRAWLMRRARGR